MAEPANRVELKGKVNRVIPLRYTPAGSAVLEFSLAVTQEYVDGSSVGYFDMVLFGSLAETQGREIRIGKTFTVKGNLWSRAYRDRRSNMIKETKVIVHQIEGEK